MIKELLPEDANMYSSLTEWKMHLERETLLPSSFEGIVKQNGPDLKKILNGTLLCVPSITSMERYLIHYQSPSCCFNHKKIALWKAVVWTWKHTTVILDIMECKEHFLMTLNIECKFKVALL